MGTPLMKVEEIVVEACNVLFGDRKVFTVECVADGGGCGCQPGSTDPDRQNFCRCRRRASGGRIRGHRRSRRFCRGGHPPRGEEPGGHGSSLGHPL